MSRAAPSTPTAATGSNARPRRRSGRSSPTRKPRVDTSPRASSPLPATCSASGCRPGRTPTSPRTVATSSRSWCGPGSCRTSATCRSRSWQRGTWTGCTGRYAGGAAAVAARSGGSPSGTRTRSLSKALGDAVRRGHLTVNPAAAVDPPARDDSVERVEPGRGARVPGRGRRRPAARRLAARALDRHAAWRAARTAVARRRRDDDHGRAAGTPTSRRARPVHPGTTKTRRVRRAHVDDSVAVALRSWKVEQATERLAFGPAWRTDGGHRLATEGAWVVTEPNGYIVEPDTLRARFQRLARDAGVPVIPLHGARHTYAELALSSGVRLDVVSRQLGHASISTTANVYSHDSDEAAAEAAKLVARTLG